MYDAASCASYATIPPQMDVDEASVRAVLVGVRNSSTTHVPRFDDALFEHCLRSVWASRF